MLEGKTVSIIIPVHNGAKYIKKLVRSILRQSISNFEIILVENGSEDDSLNICNCLAEQYSQIISTCSKEKGTSLARKKGIDLANGKYIVFCDQDDCYENSKSIQHMVTRIQEDGSQICQFGYYSGYNRLIKRRHHLGIDKVILSKKELMEKEIGGITSSGKYSLSPNVWSKIYDAALLKKAVEKISKPLFYAEDLYLNLAAISEKEFKLISFYDNAYYIWHKGIGFSSSNTSGDILFEEYEIIKPMQIKILQDHSCAEELYFNCHLETIYFMKNIVLGYLKGNHSEREKELKIQFLNQYVFVQDAKQYFNRQPDNLLWDELNFLCGDWGANEFSNYYSLA